MKFPLLTKTEIIFPCQGSYGKLFVDLKQIDQILYMRWKFFRSRTGVVIIYRAVINIIIECTNSYAFQFHFVYSNDSFLTFLFLSSMGVHSKDRRVSISSAVIVYSGCAAPVKKKVSLNIR